VRVGRAALDEHAIRLIEESNPGIEFDWTKILKSQEPHTEARSPVQHDRRARPRPREFPARESAPPPPRQSPERAIEPPGNTLATQDTANTAVVLPFPQPVGAEDESPSNHEATAASARLGPEGLSRLRARHAEILTRIAEKIADPVRREQLKADAERLNPDTWLTDAEVTSGLEGYETVFETLRSVIGRRRKRRRRRTAAEASAEAPGRQQHGPEPDGTSTEPGDEQEPADPDDESADL
jgi:hypothetical protein